MHAKLFLLSCIQHLFVYFCSLCTIGTRSECQFSLLCMGLPLHCLPAELKEEGGVGEGSSGMNDQEE